MSDDVSDKWNCFHSNLVIDVIKTVLYLRGQFPMPIEQLKILTQKFISDSSPHIFGDLHVFSDNNVQNKELETQPLNRFPPKTHSLIDAVTKLDNYFCNLESLLQSNQVLEIVLSLGNNFMIPKEVYHIKLPTKCLENNCRDTNSSSQQKLRRQVLKDLFQHSLLQDLQTEKLMAINVMLLLIPGANLTEHMEYKVCYRVPQLPKLIVMELNKFCCHDLSKQEEQTVSENDEKQMWVKLKPEIKGLPNKALNV